MNFRLTPVVLVLPMLVLSSCFASHKPPEPDPGRAKRYVAAGMVKLEEKMPRAALEEFDEAVKYDPNSSEAHYQRGNALVDMGNPSDAVPAYGTAIFLAPSFVNALFNRALTYAALGSYKNAVRDFLEVIRVAPDDRETHRNLGVLYDRYFEGEKEKAIAAYRKYLELGGQDPDIRTRIEQLESAGPRGALTPEQMEALRRQVEEMQGTQGPPRR
ncbi:MAG: tetratricopeptide repeat protein [Planctomycetes bacterium]|nr:tetratricopeptide repeat protein [Planctomycetota bacterium]